MKMSQKSKNSLVLALLVNKKGTPYFGIKGNSYHRINCVKSPPELLSLFRGVVSMLRPISNGQIMFNFFSRGPVRWTVELDKSNDKLILRLFEVEFKIIDPHEDTGLYSAETIQHWAFRWEGSTEEFDQAVQDLLVQSPFQQMGVLKKGLIS